MCVAYDQILVTVLKGLTTTGLNVQGLTQMACDCRMMDTESRVATVQTVAGHMQDSLEIQREVAGGMCSKRCTGEFFYDFFERVSDI